MYGSVPADQVAPDPRPRDGAEGQGLLRGQPQPRPTGTQFSFCALLLGLALLVTLVLYHFLQPPPKIPKHWEPRCPKGNLDIMGECRDRGEFGVDGASRAFVFENHANFPVWVAGIGPPTYHADPAITGFQLQPGQYKVISLPSTLESVRFWPRTGCRYVQDTISQMGVNVNITKFRCDTGDCGSILNMYGMECQMVSGLPPATLAEFSLSTKGNDFYDLSNVDGYNVGMKIEPYNYEKANIEDPDFDCGAPGCVMDTSKCPDELKFKDSLGVTHCLSICQAIYNEKQRARHPRLQELWDMQTDRGFMRDQLCCTCGTGGGLCESLGSPCTYGCSPFVDSYSDAGYSTRKCENIPGTYLPKWPKASNGENYASVFNKQCPEAYSWQFNDDQSTYQCRLADYKVKFHSHRSGL